MKTFTLNSKLHPVKEIDFNFICDLEEEGLSLEQISEKPMSMIRHYIAYCLGSSKEVAGKEIESHLINGGDLSDIADVMNGAMEDSGFFQALNKGTQKKATTHKGKKTAEVVEISEA